MTKLKPCPFCGGKAELRTMTYSGGKVNGVFCTEDLKAEYPHGHFIDNFATKPEAIEAWNNKRAGETFIPNRKLVMAAPRMYQLLKDYCGLIECYVSIYDNFPDDLQEVSMKAREIIEEVEDEEDDNDD